VEVTTQRRGRTLFHPFRAARGDTERLQVILGAQQAISQERELEGLLRVAIEHGLNFTRLAVGAGLIQTANGDRVVVRSVAGNVAAGDIDRLTPGTVVRGPLLGLYE